MATKMYNLIYWGKDAKLDDDPKLYYHTFRCLATARSMMRYKLAEGDWSKARLTLAIAEGRYTTPAESDWLIRIGDKEWLEQP